MKQHLFPRLALATATSLVLAACGDDGGGSSEPEPVDDPQVQAQGTATASNAAALKDIGGTDAEADKGKVHLLGTAISQLRGSVVAVKARAAAGAAADGIPSGAGQVPQGLEDPAGAATPEVQYKDNHLTASFTFQYDMSGQQVVYNYIADMMIVPSDTVTTIDGSFDLTYTANINVGAIPGAGAAVPGAAAGSVPESVSVDYEMHARFEGLTVGTCPEGGTLTLDYKADVTVEGGSDAYADALKDSPEYGGGTITVTYGKDEAGACTVSVEAT